MAKERGSRDRQRHEATVSKKSEAKIGGGRVPIRDEESRVPVDDLQEIKNPARVRVGGGITKRAGGEFEFVRVDISIEWPCEPNKEAVKKTYKRLSSMVDTMIEDELAYAEDRMD